MQKLLMLGTNLGSVELLKHAKQTGIYTIATDYYAPEHSAAKQVADEYWMISTADLDALEAKCQETGVTGIITGVSEYNTEQQMALCSRLGLPCYCTPEAWHFSRNKADFKAMCEKFGLPVATDYIVSDPPAPEELARIQYPVIVKPVDCCSNKGIRFCYNEQ